MKSLLPSSPAVIDTSFWSLCAHVGLVPYLWQQYRCPLWVPSAVYSEVFHTPRDYPDQLQMTEALEDDHLCIADPEHPQPIFHPGERSVLFLAQERQAVALIDEFSAHEYAAHALNIPVVSVAEFLSDAWEWGILSREVARRYLATLEALHASPKIFLDYAWQQLNDKEE